MLGIARRIAAMLEAGAEAGLLDQARTHAVAATGHDLESRVAYNLTGGAPRSKMEQNRVKGSVIHPTLGSPIPV